LLKAINGGYCRATTASKRNSSLMPSMPAALCRFSFNEITGFGGGLNFYLFSKLS
jgi:hypothetical protein